jgi:hypothetical protein
MRKKRVGRVENKKQVIRQKNLFENRVVCALVLRECRKIEENSSVGENNNYRTEDCPA